MSCCTKCASHVYIFSMRFGMFSLEKKRKSLVWKKKKSSFSSTVYVLQWKLCLTYNNQDKNVSLHWQVSKVVKELNVRLKITGFLHLHFVALLMSLHFAHLFDHLAPPEIYTKEKVTCHDKLQNRFTIQKTSVILNACISLPCILRITVQQLRHLETLNSDLCSRVVSDTFAKSQRKHVTCGKKYVNSSGKLISLLAFKVGDVGIA